MILSFGYEFATIDDIVAAALLLLELAATIKLYAVVLLWLLTLFDLWVKKPLFFAPSFIVILS